MNRYTILRDLETGEPVVEWAGHHAGTNRCQDRAVEHVQETGHPVAIIEASEVVVSTVEPFQV